MKYLIIILVSFLPFTVSAQILRAYGVIDIGASFPIGTATGAKFAYKAIDSSFYRWVSGNTWVKILESSIDPDTLYLKQLSGTTALVDGDTIDISTYFLKSDTTSAFASYLKRPVGWGLSLLTGKYPFVDSSKVASRYYVSTSPTTIAANYIATSNGSNLVARNLFDNNTYVGILNSKPVIFGSQTVAGLPTGVDGYWLDVSNYKWPARYNSTAGAWIYPMQSILAGGVGTAGSLLFLDANGRATQNNAALNWNNSTNTLNVATPLTTSVNLAKFQGGQNPVANILFNVTGFQSTISGHLMRVASTQGTAPYINMATGLIEAGFGTVASTNKFNVRSALNVSGKFGFFFISNADRIHDAIQHSSYIAGFDRGLDFATYDHRTNGTLDKGEILFRMSPSKEVWVGDQSVNTSYSFNVTQPSLGYGAIVTTAGSANVTGFGLTTFFTKDFNVGSTVTVNGNSYTVATITNDYTMSFTTTVPTPGTYPYTITSNTDRLGIYKSGGVLIKGASGQTRALLDVQNSSGNTLTQVNKDGDFTVKKPSNPDSVTINKAGVLIEAKGKDGSFDSEFRVYDYGYIYNALAISSQDDARYYYARARGTIAAPSALVKDDRIGGTYFLAHNGTDYKKTGYIGAVVDSVYSGAKPQAKLIFGVSEDNSPETSSFWRFLIEATRNISPIDNVVGRNLGVGFGSNISTVETATIDARLHVKGVGTTTDKTMLLEDSGGADILTVTDDKTIQAHGYGQGNMKASDLGATASKFVAKFSDGGKVLDYYLARDTFIEDVTLFSVGTLMNDCQELTIVSSMTATAPSHQEIRFPDAGDHLRGKKIIVYQKKKEAGIYVPQIKVVGGVSRLYFTTTPGIGGTDPSDQSTLSIDDSTWSSHGTTFEFTCLRIDNTPSYRWVLKQR